MVQGRKTITAHIFEDLQDLEDSEGHWLVLYDFAQAAGEVTPHGFFTNLNRILDMGEAIRVQKSVIECRRLKSARAIEALCRYYGARDIDIYEVGELLESWRARKSSVN